jgi:protein O-mannosyl-transferase
MSESSVGKSLNRISQTMNGAPILLAAHRRNETLKHNPLLCVLLFLAVLICYLPISYNEFIAYDDNSYITENRRVQAGLTRETVKWAFTTFDQANWHPLTWISHALDCQLFGLNPAAHHYVNVLFHALNAVLLFLLLQTATGCRWRSLIVAALFALHPVNVESVAWAAERKNVLSMFFFLLAFHSYVWYVRRNGYWRYSLTTFFFALALLAKPQVITLDRRSRTVNRRNGGNIGCSSRKRRCLFYPRRAR